MGWASHQNGGNNSYSYNLKGQIQMYAAMIGIFSKPLSQNLTIYGRLQTKDRDLSTTHMQY